MTDKHSSLFVWNESDEEKYLMTLTLGGQVPQPTEGGLRYQVPIT